MKGVSSGSGWLANRGKSIKEGRKRVSFGLCVFSGSFGIRSIVLCKCSGKVLIGYSTMLIKYSGNCIIGNALLFRR